MASAGAGRDLDLANAFAGVLSGMEFGSLKIVIGDKIGYSQKTDTLFLPGVPFGDVDEDLKEDLRAYIAHESIGERGHTTWRPKDFPDAFLRRLVNGMNDARIDRIALNEWPGAGMAIRTRLQKDWADFRGMVKAGADWKTSGALSSALRYIGENIATRQEVADLTPGFKWVMETISPVLDEVDWDGSEAQIIEAARRINDLLKSEIPPSLHSDDAEELSEDGEGDSEKGESESDKSQKGKPKPSSGKKGIGKKSDAENDGKETGKSDAKDGKDGEKPAAPDVKTMEERLKEKLGRRMNPAVGDGTFREARGKERGAQIYTVPPNAITRCKTNGAGRHGEAQKPSRALVGRIMRLFRSLQAAEDRVILKRRLVGELDTDRLADLHRGSQAIFSARKRGETESLAVYISVDLTGSMAETKMDAVRNVVLALNEALGRLEIPTAIVGWSGTRDYGSKEWQDWEDRYTQPYGVQFSDMKTFDDSWKDAVGRIQSNGAYSANADVQGLADGISQLARRQETRKLLFFITDGEPCLDWEPTFCLDANLLERTMKSLISKGKTRGILTVACGVGLGSYAREAMNDIFGEGNYAEIAVRTDMVDGIGAQFEKAIKRIVHTEERKGRR